MITSSPINRNLPSTSGAESQRSLSGSSDSLMRRRRKFGEIEKDEVKTNKKNGKRVKLFELFMREKFNITVDSSDSETE